MIEIERDVFGSLIMAMTKYKAIKNLVKHTDGNYISVEVLKAICELYDDEKGDKNGVFEKTDPGTV